jgi:hypothetical protein
VTADGLKFLVDGAVRSGADGSIKVIVNWAAAGADPWRQSVPQQPIGQLLR